ncbi:hypothetical protein AJ87_37675 [Rhizobium yanglingense]|nr:hypothetical protein AJ87_37675 [Rhizobium yanglingense]
MGLLAIASNVAGPVISYAQTAPASQTRSWTLPASLASKKLPDVLVEQTKGEIDAILGTAAGDNSKLTTVTEGLVLSLPSSLPQVVSKAVQANTTETASAMGLGLCMATSSLMNAANDPATILPRASRHATLPVRFSPTWQLRRRQVPRPMQESPTVSVFPRLRAAARPSPARQSVARSSQPSSQRRGSLIKRGRWCTNHQRRGRQVCGGCCR